MCDAERSIDASARHAVSHGLPESRSASALEPVAPPPQLRASPAFSGCLASTGGGGGDASAPVVVGAGACCTVCWPGGCAYPPWRSRLSWPNARKTFCSAFANCASASPRFSGAGIAEPVIFESARPEFGAVAAPQPAPKKIVAATSTKAAEPKRTAEEEERFIDVSTLDVRPGGFGSRRMMVIRERVCIGLLRIANRRSGLLSVRCTLPPPSLASQCSQRPINTL
jgi:hypothetical protein